MLIVYDIGGTMTKYGILKDLDNFKFLECGEFPSMALEGGSRLMARLCGHIQEKLEVFPIEGIAISSAGQINPFTGEVVYATDTIPFYTGMNPKILLENQFKLPVSIENDVNCFLLGEMTLSQLEGYVLGITLGTGIGGAFSWEGRLLRGASFSAGEIGHMVLHEEGPICTCGARGCYEQYASTTALKKLVRTQLGYEDLKLFFEKCKALDEEALSVYHAWLEDVTDGLRNMVHAYNPNVIVLGGAIAAQGDYLAESLKSHLFRKIMPSFSKSLMLIVSQHGNLSNLCGAVVHYKGVFK